MTGPPLFERDGRQDTGNHPIRLLFRATQESRRMELATREMALALHPHFVVADFLTDSDCNIEGDTPLALLDSTMPIRKQVEENEMQLELLTDEINERTNNFEQCIQDAIDYNCEDLEERFGEENWEAKYNYECAGVVAETQAYRRVLIKQKKIKEKLISRGIIRKKLANLVPPMDQHHVINNMKTWNSQWKDIHNFIRKIYFHLMECEDQEAFLASRENIPPQPEKNLVLDVLAFQEACDTIFVDNYYGVVKFAMQLPAGTPPDRSVERRLTLRRPYEVEDIVE